MSRFVVVHHAHHADEDGGIFRLVYAEAFEHARIREEPNPYFDPDAEVNDENKPVLVHEDSFVVLANHQEVVWDAGDPRWEGRAADDIAAEQRRIVKDAITDRVAEAERAEAQVPEHVDLGGVGTEL